MKEFRSIQGRENGKTLTFPTEPPPPPARLRIPPPSSLARSTWPAQPHPYSAGTSGSIHACLSFITDVANRIQDKCNVHVNSWGVLVVHGGRLEEGVCAKGACDESEG